MTAALVSADAGELADLEVVLVVDGTSGFEAPVQLGDPSAATETVGTAGAHNLMVAVVNTATAAIRRPSLCIGTGEEVQACIAAVLPPPPPPDGEDDGGCACATAPASWSAALLVLLLRRRR